MPRISHPAQAAPLDFPGMAAAPPLSPAGSARMYFDTAAGKLKVSESGAAYVDVVGGGGGGGGWTDDGTVVRLTTPTDAVGIGTAAPGAKLDVAEDVAFGLASPAALAAGNNNDYAIPAADMIRLTGTAPGSVLTGLAGGVRGRMITLINITAVTITLNNQDAASLAENRIITATGLAQTMNINGKAILRYDSVTARWRVIVLI
jgi:hypothetical protein